MLLLQGVAQLEGEGLAKAPETTEGVRGRLVIVAIFFAAGLCGCLIHQTIRFLSQGLRDFRSRLLRAAFDGSVFWAGTCLFFCLLILAASFQARWQVARSYYWVAGGAGVCLLVLLGTAELLHRRLAKRRPEAIQQTESVLTQCQHYLPVAALSFAFFLAFTSHRTQEYTGKPGLALRLPPLAKSKTAGTRISR
jgi:hypothetical protein